MNSRRRLNNRRPNISIAFEADGLHYVATFGFHASGVPAEVFLNGQKVGSAADTNARDAAIAASFALQHGADVNALRAALSRSVARPPAFSALPSTFSPRRRRRDGWRAPNFCLAHLLPARPERRPRVTGALKNSASAARLSLARRAGGKARRAYHQCTKRRMTMVFEQKENTGAIFVNDRKTEDTHLDSTGTALIDGVEYYVSAWRREAKSGKRYLALSFKRKNADATASDKSRSRAEELDDRIPF
jgi:hypothetical protein